MQVVRHADARAFLERAERWLEASDMENALVLTSARNARVDESRYPKPVYWATVEDGGRIVGCAVRTPPYRLGVTALNDTAIAAVIVNVAAGLRDPVRGQRARAHRRTCWPRRGAGRAAALREVSSRHRLYSLRVLIPPARPAARRTAARDRSRRRARALMGTGVRDARPGSKA